MNRWNQRYYHGWKNKYPFTDIVSLVFNHFGGAQPRKKIRILDLGCGGGHHLLFLAKEGFTYHGIDGSSRAIQLAKSRLKKEGYSTSHVIQGLFEDMPYPENFFDCILDRGALVCNRCREISVILEKLHKVLKSGGILHSQYFHVSDFNRQAARSLGQGDYTGFRGRLRQAGILHFVTERSLKGLFSQFKLLDITKISSESLFAYPQRKSVWLTATCRK
jgi:ubiquinone/menaquinone biosynthesis C-methylase UbiE